MDFVDDDDADLQLLQYQQRANLHFDERHRVTKARSRTAQELRINAPFGRFRRQRNRKDGNGLGAADRVDDRRVRATKLFDQHRFAHSAMRIDRKTWWAGRGWVVAEELKPFEREKPIHRSVRVALMRRSSVKFMSAAA